MDAPLPTRPEVRALVARQAAALREAASRGENVHALGLDQLDQMRALAALLEHAHGADAAAAFLALWSEETQALAAHASDEAARLTLATADTVERQDATAQAVGAFVAVLLGGGLVAFLLTR